MCGICGFNFKDDSIKNMTDALLHRGPDDVGYYLNDYVSLGIRRLSIIDLKHGKQPICNEDENIWVVFNGEIYNFRDLRKTLEKLGHTFKTNTDTEVIIHAYEEYGYECVKHFNGMFAFCIYDGIKNILFLARDRFGEKPLYYYNDTEKFIFASEIKALLANRNIPRIPNDDIIMNYLVYGKLPEDCEETFFKGIKKLLPGYYMIVSNNKIHTKTKYYTINLNTNMASLKNNIEECKSTLLYLLKDSIRLRLLSDVKVGTCLSGGLDSSAIVCLLYLLKNEHHNLECNSLGNTIECFSAIFDDKSIDESKYIKDVIDKTNASWNYTSPNAERFIDEIKELLYYQEEPVESSSVYAQRKVMQLASKKVKVLLDGQGSDEIFGGYLGYYRYYLFELIKQRKYKEFIFEILRNSNIMFRLIQKYKEHRSQQKIIYKLLNKKILHMIRYTNTPPKFESLNERLLYDLEHTLPIVLRYEDKNSMSFSIESRLPFLDHRLVEFAFTLPTSYKIYKGYQKYILRNALKDILPTTIRLRRDKIGFVTPEMRWLIENKEDILTLFKSDKFASRRYFNQDEIINVFETFCENEIKYLAQIFWRILNIEIWLRIFFDNDERLI